MTTTIRLSGGCLGNETMYVRCNLAEASATVQANYMTGEGWQGTQYQCADARHTDSGLAAIGQSLAEIACEDRDECEWEVVDDSYTVADGNANSSGLTGDEAVEAIREWYRDADTWGDGDSDDELHDAIGEAIDSVDAPGTIGLESLRRYADEIRQVVAEAMGARSFAGHGRYEVSAPDSIGLSLTVKQDEVE